MLTSLVLVWQLWPRGCTTLAVGLLQASARFINCCSVRGFAGTALELPLVAVGLLGIPSSTHDPAILKRRLMH